MAGVDTVIFVEHVARELNVAVLVKYWLWREHRLTAEIRPLSRDLDLTLAELRPHVVALPWLRFIHSSPTLRRIVSAWPGATYIDLCHEQLLSPFNFQFRKPGDEIKKLGSYHHVWSKEYRDFLIDHGVSADRLLENSAPFLSLYNKPYTSDFPSREELAQQYGLDIEKRWLFFPENYGWAFKRNPELREFYVKNGVDFAFLVTMRDRVQDYMQEAVRWLANAATSDVEVIFRPRPAVHSKVWTEQFQKLIGGVPGNFKIIKEGTVREWVLACDATMSSYSTTLLDAVAAGKPAFMLLPEPVPDWLYCKWFELFPRIYCQEDLDKFFKSDWRTLAEQENSPPLEDIFCADGDACKGIAQILANLRQQSNFASNFVRPADTPTVEKLRNYVVHSTSPMRNALRSRPPTNQMEVLLDTAEMDRFDQSVVRERLGNWIKTLSSTLPEERPVSEDSKQLISVCICTYNRAELLSDVVESVLLAGSIEGNFEIIIIDNNSTDRTRSIAQKFQNADDRVRYIFEPEQGLSRARNRALKEARGAYLAFLDDECRVPLQWMQVAAEIIEDHKPEVFGGPYDAIFEDVPPLWMKSKYFSSPRHTNHCQPLPVGKFVPGGNMFWRTDVLKSIGGFEESLGVRGEKILVGEETDAQKRLRLKYNEAKIIYDPNLAVGHLVRANKIKWAWIIRHRFKSGWSNAQIFPSNYGGGAATVLVLVRTAYIIWMGLLPVHFRSRTEFPLLGNFVFEKIMPQIVALGRDLSNICKVGKGQEIKTEDLLGNLFRRIRDALWLRYWNFRLQRTRVSTPLRLTRLGSAYGGWCIPEEIIKPGFHCYCVGAGEDVSFEEILLKRYDCEVFAFDPTPRAISYVKRKQKKLPGLNFLPYGIWSSDEEKWFYAPRNVDHVSHSITNLQGTSDGFYADCKTLKTTMRKLGHTHIDLLKLDIEGAEHEVIQSMLRDKIFPKIICIEIERPVTNANFRRTLASLQQANYTLIAVHDFDLTFIHNDAQEHLSGAASNSRE